MLRRAGSLLLLIWLLGFLVFAVTLPTPADKIHADAVVVLTGSQGRIERGLAVIRHHWADRMLVAGVDSEVRPGEFARQYHVRPGLMQCCISLGYQSVDTRSNATETAQWVSAVGAKSVRLVTSDWHMRRAAFELRRALPPSVTLIEDAVPTQPSLRTLFVEYNKLLARRLLRFSRGI